MRIARLLKSVMLLSVILALPALSSCEMTIPLTVSAPTRDVAVADVITPADTAASVILEASPMPTASSLVTALVNTVTATVEPQITLSSLEWPTPWPDVPGAVGRLVIPRLGLDAPIVEVSWELTTVEGQTVATWQIPEGAVGHHRHSPAPGEKGNCVLSGHSRGDQEGVFQRLEDLQPGDQVLVTFGAAQVSYRAERVDKVPELGRSLIERREHAQAMADYGDTRLTLITCWPTWAYTHRLIVVAYPE